MKRIITLIFLAGLIWQPLPAEAQKKKKGTASPQASNTDPDFYKALEWRNIGPYRGGRSVAIAGVPTKPNTFYVGYTGGGLWKTSDSGNSFQNISDGYFKSSSIGAIAVSDSDPNVVYVGTGEAAVRGVMTIHGDGVYKSTDAGKTWKHLGLENTRQISRVRVDPKNPDILYVAAQGSPYGANKERGIYRSKDGGKNWELVLHVNENTGASDLSMDATNANVLYAAFWEHRRYPWKVESGGAGSAIYKSTDGGDTWKKLEKGLPKVMGKIGVAVSPVNPERVWAIVEAEDGGLFRSEDGGSTWTNINKERVLRARAWYYMHIFADPVDENKVYVLNAPFMQSIDGGKSFTPLPTPHGDNHDLWINPLQPHIWANANDGGGNISHNKGANWSTQENQPTAQIYRVNADNMFPYTVYGGQQDNSTIAIPNAHQGQGIPWSAFYPVGGCESAFVAFNPDAPDYIYAGCYQGIISEWNATTKNTQDVMAYPYLGLGSKPIDQKYRFNWNAPIVMSKFDPSVIYHAGNVVLRSKDRGLSWEEVSPDLTRNKPEFLDYGGGPITKEGAGGEVYQTIFYLVESPHDPQVLWAGSDDGLVHVTRDGGKNWQQVTPKGLTSTTLINAIEVSPHDANTVYLAVNDYKVNDFTPHVFKTTDGGKSWKRMVNGIQKEHFTRVVREDPKRKDLLYLGTESGLYVSFNGGEQWMSFQSNLPITPIMDLKVHHNDLIAATGGRAFWILDDLSPLHQQMSQPGSAGISLLKPADAISSDYIQNKNAAKQFMGQNPPHGALIHFAMNKAFDDTELKIEIYNEADKLVRTLSSKAEKEADKITVSKGLNRVHWDLNHHAPKRPDGLLAGFGEGAYRAVPGSYKVKLTYGGTVLEEAFAVKSDPRYNVPMAAFEEQRKIQEGVNASLDEIYQSVNKLRLVRRQISLMKEMLKDSQEHEDLRKQSDLISKRSEELENLLVQPQQKTFQDVINFENKLDNHFIHLSGIVNSAIPPVTNGQRQRYNDLQQQWQALKQDIDTFMKNDVKRYNDKLRSQEVTLIGFMQ
ncbi:glycosyl hydrolase [Pontibacter sp. JH31]|uniref:Glycosyl hydrolase n=1 Tax=Pontibacter aquaedesilientis TaxID=2766980 RepID=A0ABR7XFD4_9BACT|nr:glycosyl hydrolase [Pontibacter aquaedesilientis]MBD1397020.1 glycosyl hydrolase [Pontibacter aquaedesilientis]